MKIDVSITDKVTVLVVLLLFFLGGAITITYFGLFTILNPTILTPQFVVGSWFVLVMFSMSIAIWVISIAVRTERRWKNAKRKDNSKPKGSINPRR
jgi:hypothetical protein